MGTEPIAAAGKARLEPVDDLEREAVELRFEAGVTPAVALPAPSAWRLSVEVPGYWAPVQAVTVTEESRRHSVTLWPVGEITGRLRAEGEETPLPSSLQLRFASAWKPGREQRIAETGTTCPVTTDAFRCQVPAASLDLVLRAKGAVSHYLWEVAVPPGKKKDLGTFALRPGASLVGRVETAEGSLDPGTCTATLSPFVPPGPGGTVQRGQVERATSRAAVTETGFFHFEGVRPGNYVLEVEQPGFAVSRIFPLEIWQGSETALAGPVLLRRPLDLEVRLDPPLDWRNEPWRVLLLRSSDFSARTEPAPAFQGPAGRNGVVAVSGQSPGTFLLRVSDSLGNQFLAEDSLRIDTADDASLAFDLEVVRLAGEVLYGDEPLAGARLFFGGRHGSQRAVFEADDEGLFTGVLPREGVWSVEVETSSPPLLTEIETIVETVDGEAVVAIMLPRTEVYGRVVDRTGRAAAGARVRVSAPGSVHEATAEDDGAFSLAAVPPGIVELRASHRSGEPGAAPTASASLLGIVPEAAAAGPFLLQLQETEVFWGDVLSPLGPVPGAGVSVSSRNDRGAFYGSAARTDLRGTFQAQVIADSREITVVVSPPGFGLRVFEVTQGGGPHLFEVTPEAGTLSFSLPEMDRSQVLAVLQGVHPVPNNDLVHWARGQGAFVSTPGRWTLPGLAPGPYRVCLGSSAALAEEASRGEDWKAGLAGCREGYLAPGAVLDLGVFEPRAQASAPPR